jgi:outer membrane lipoprotein SlyB
MKLVFALLIAPALALLEGCSTTPYSPEMFRSSSVSQQMRISTGTVLDIRDIELYRLPNDTRTWSSNGGDIGVTAGGGIGGNLLAGSGPVGFLIGASMGFVVGKIGGAAIDTITGEPDRVSKIKAKEVRISFDSTGENVTNVTDFQTGSQLRPGMKVRIIEGSFVRRIEIEGS